MSTTEPSPPHCHLLLCARGNGKSHPPPVSALFLSPLQLHLRWENHGKGTGTKPALEQLCHPTTRLNEPCLGFDFFPRFLSAALARAASRKGTVQLSVAYLHVCSARTPGTECTQGSLLCLQSKEFPVETRG